MTNHSSQTYFERMAKGDPQYRQLNGDGYSAGAFFEPGANNSKDLYIENTSADTYFVSFFAEVRADEGTYFTTGYNVTEDTQGDSGTLISRRTDTPVGDSVAVVRTGGDNETGVYTPSKTSPKRVGGSGGSAASVAPATITDTGSNVIGPNTSILIRAENFSGSSSAVSIEAAWVEVPEGEIPE